MDGGGCFATQISSVVNPELRLMHGNLNRFIQCSQLRFPQLRTISSRSFFSYLAGEESGTVMAGNAEKGKKNLCNHLI